MWRSCRKKKEGFKVQVASLPLGSRVVEPKCNFRRVSRARRVASHSIAYPQSSTSSDMAKQLKQNGTGCYGLAGKSQIWMCAKTTNF